MRGGKQRILFLMLGSIIFWAGCTPLFATKSTSTARLAKPTENTSELISLPPPKGKITVAVYNFRDQTGQYKTVPNISSFSTAVTQGAASVLVQALKDSKWFIPVEREGLQDLLTERKIIRAAIEKDGKNDGKDLPALEVAGILIEGGIIGYDTNYITGGLGAKYFGAGGSIQYRMDQVTVCIRAVDVRSGRILKSLATSNTILSKEISAGLSRYVSFKRLLEVETGVTTNEPILLAVRGAIEKAVVSLIIEGVVDKLWELKNPDDFNSTAFKEYFEEDTI